MVYEPAAVGVNVNVFDVDSGYVVDGTAALSVKIAEAFEE